LAISGVAIWFFGQKSSPWRWVLLALALVFTQLSPTDIFPAAIRDQWVAPYVLKAVPCIAIWISITYELLFEDFSQKLIPAAEA
jgi:hypothetical protein